MTKTLDFAEQSAVDAVRPSYPRSVTFGRLRWPLGRKRTLEFGGGALVLVVAAALYSAFSIDGILTRDASIYVYGGQQLTQGVPPYSSIFDPKTPFATLLCGLGAGIADLGGFDVHVIRIVFYVASLATVVALYLLALRLWRSVPAAVVSALVFVSFWGFARDALAGPDAKTPGVLFVVLTMWLLAGRKWFWGAFFAGLAFLVWQPLIIYPVVAVVAAAATAERGRRLRAAGFAGLGAVLPVAAVSLYFAAVGAFGNFLTATVTFPLTGIQRGNETVGHRISHIFWVVHRYYGFGGVLFWIGLALTVCCVVQRFVHGRGRLLSVLRDPVVLVVFVTLLFEVGYAMSDFQSYPDLFALLPYGALMWGWPLALVAERARPGWLRETVRNVAGVLVAALMTITWVWYGSDPHNVNDLGLERADAASIEAAIVPGTSLWVLGDPTVLVLTHRRNPDRYVYLESGVAVWKIKHTPGGFPGWLAQISRVHPSVVVIGYWTGRIETVMKSWLHVDAGYALWWVGRWRVLLTPDAVARAEAAGVPLSHEAATYGN